MDSSYQYDHREIFKLSDGGTIHIDYKGFNPTKDSQRTRSLIIMVLGMTGDSYGKLYIKFVDQIFKGNGVEGGFDVAVVNYRGMAGSKLTTPLLHGFNSTGDIAEPLRYIYDNHCKGTKHKTFVLGFSMGAIILTNALAKIDRENGGKPTFDGALIA